MILRGICQFIISACRRLRNEVSKQRFFYVVIPQQHACDPHGGRIAADSHNCSECLDCYVPFSYRIFLFCLCHRDIYKWFTIADKDTSFLSKCIVAVDISDYFNNISIVRKIFISVEHSEKDYKVKSENLYRWWYIVDVEISNGLEDMEIITWNYVII